MVISCAVSDRSLEFKLMGKKGEGTFSEVVKCQAILDGALCASKRMKGKFSRFEWSMYKSACHKFLSHSLSLATKYIYIYMYIYTLLCCYVSQLLRSFLTF